MLAQIKSVLGFKQPDNRPVKRIAIIGAGSSGIAQAKQVLDAFAYGKSEYKADIVVFEAKEKIGGVWVEQTEPGPQLVRYAKDGTLRCVANGDDDNPSPIYAGLRTNLPNHLMAFRDYPFPKDVQLFPRADVVEDYLTNYAKAFHIEKLIRFNTSVTRLYKLDDATTGSSTAKWSIESSLSGSNETITEDFDLVSVANGHYDKTNVPTISGLKDFSGEILHSRWYRRPGQYRGKRILVVGAYASGSDVARELASNDLPSDVLPESMQQARSRLQHAHPEDFPDPSPRTTVYQSSSMKPNDLTSHSLDPNKPWTSLIEHKVLVEKIETRQGNPSTIHFKDGTTLTDIDLIIFATGYLYYFPFCKSGDAPWNKNKIVDDVIKPLDLPSIKGRNEWQVDGIQGLGMRGLDELMLFLKNDRTCAFIGLAYLTVPFPMGEIQSHLTAWYWAGRLPSFPDYPTLPIRQNTPKPDPPPSTDDKAKTAAGQAGNDTSNDPAKSNSGNGNSSPSKSAEKRYTELVRGDYVFGFPFEYDYQNYLLDLTSEGDGGKAKGWGIVEDWRYPLRKNKDLRAETLGY